MAAGNNDSRQPLLAGRVPRTPSSVGGARATDWRSRADFSNYGGWVDVYAPGQDLINAFATGPFTCQCPAITGQDQDVLRHGAVERHFFLDARS